MPSLTRDLRLSDHSCLSAGILPPLELTLAPVTAIAETAKRAQEIEAQIVIVHSVIALESIGQGQT